MLFFIPQHLFAINNPLNLRRGCKALNDSDIILKWRVPNDLCTSFQAYYIYGRKDSFSAFGLIDSVKTLSQQQYTHKGAFLLANTWQYFIVLHNDCFGNPTISSDTISIDLTQTNSQYIDSVSVDPVTGKYIIGWKVNTSNDLAGYKIYTINGANNIILADVDYSTVFFSDISSSPTTTVKTYAIAAYDSCNNITAIIDKHTPIKLSVSFDSCSHRFSLNWSDYIGFPILKYQILASINGNPFFKIQDFLTVAGVLSYNFSDTLFHDGDNVCFVVRAFHASDPSISSTSNKTYLVIKFVSLAHLNYISQVNVINKNSIRIDWITDQPFFISAVYFQQSTDGLNYTTRKIISPSLNTFSFVADSLNADETKYFFRTIVFNGCNQAQDTSTFCNSILLNAKKITSSANRVSWNSYLNFDANVEKYEIYQGTGDPSSGHTYFNVATVVADSIGFTDVKFPDDILNDGVCYYVVAYEKPGNAFGVNGAACKSNEICVPGELLVFFPNAFMPLSLIEKNKVFKPRGLYIDYANSWMTIYNRWGETIYECNDLLTGWNGTNTSGTPVPVGQYIYVSSIASLKGKGQNIKGIVNLIR